jgi:hypothetical protein
MKNYLGNALDGQCIRKARSVRYMTIATLLAMSLIFCVFILAAYIGHRQTVAQILPATIREKEAAGVHLAKTFDAESKALYDYYVERSR